MKRTSLKPPTVTALKKPITSDRGSHASNSFSTRHDKSPKRDTTPSCLEHVGMVVTGASSLWIMTPLRLMPHV